MKPQMQHLLLPTAREGNVLTGVCLSTGGVSLQTKGVSVQGGVSTGGLCPSRGRGKPPPRLEGDPRPMDRDAPLVLTSSGGHCSGRYACYWNAFLSFTTVHHLQPNIVKFFFLSSVVMLQIVEPNFYSRRYLIDNRLKYSFDTSAVFSRHLNQNNTQLYICSPERDYHEKYFQDKKLRHIHYILPTLSMSDSLISNKVCICLAI